MFFFSISLSAAEIETLAKRKLAPVGKSLRFFSSGYDLQTEKGEVLVVVGFDGRHLGLALLVRKEGVEV